MTHCIRIGKDYPKELEEFIGKIVSLYREIDMKPEVYKGILIKSIESFYIRSDDKEIDLREGDMIFPV